MACRSASLVTFHLGGTATRHDQREAPRLAPYLSSNCLLIKPDYDRVNGGGAGCVPACVSRGGEEGRRAL